VRKKQLIKANSLKRTKVILKISIKDEHGKNIKINIELQEDIGCKIQDKYYKCNAQY
jgi:hypothetical protein